VNKNNGEYVKFLCRETKRQEGKAKRQLNRGDEDRWIRDKTKDKTFLQVLGGYGIEERGGHEETQTTNTERRDGDGGSKKKRLTKTTGAKRRGVKKRDAGEAQQGSGRGRGMD